VRRIQRLGVLCWKAWFVLINALVIALLFPFLLASTLRERDYPWFFRLCRVWARCVLWAMGLRLRPVYEAPEDRKKPCIVVANHTSMIDILCTFLLVDAPFLFIGKIELARVPLFGFFYRRTNILVDRSSRASAHRSFLEADRRLSAGLGVCIYPEGGVPDPHIRLAPFKEGAFRLSVRNGIPILPITFVDNKRAFPYALYEGRPMRLRARIGRLEWPVGTEAEATREMKQRIRGIIEHQLEAAE